MTGLTRLPVSVVVSTLSRPAGLRRCLRALLDGAVRPAEIVVVDQGDAAATAAVLADVVPLVPVQHVRQQSRGLSLSQNAGVQAARSPVVAVVDDDCVPDPDWLAVVHREFSRATGPLLLTGRVLPLPAVAGRTRAVSSRTSTEPREWRRPTPPWQVGTGGNFAVTRNAFLAVGGNDQRLGTGTRGKAGNDLDLFHRLLRSGVPARYEPDLVVQHERSTPAEHRARRSTYGFGVGAAAGAWLREGDRSAPAVLRAWLRLRLSLLRHDPAVDRLRDEALVLGGTASGLAYGLRLPRRTATPSTRGAS